MHNDNKTQNDNNLVKHIVREYFDLKYMLPYLSKREGLRRHSSLKGYINMINCLERRATWLQKLDAEKIKLDLKIS